MKFEVQYRHIKPQTKVSKYAEEKLERLDKYELKPTHVRFIFSARRHEGRVEVLVRGPELVCQATATAEDFREAVDLALDKIEKQLHRFKSKHQHHKRFHLSKAGKLQQLTAQFDFKTFSRRSGRRAA